MKRLLTFVLAALLSLPTSALALSSTNGQLYTPYDGEGCVSDQFKIWTDLSDQKVMICQDGVLLDLDSLLTPVTSTNGGTGQNWSASTGLVNVVVGTFSLLAATDDGLAIGDGTSFELKVIGTCTGTGKAVTYDAATNTFGCNTINDGSVTPPAVQTIAAGNTIADDACGSIKRIDAAGAVSTDTTNTFTAPATGNAGCIMQVCNEGSFAITLDDNTNFHSPADADVGLAANACISVASSGEGGFWRALAPMVQN